MDDGSKFKWKELGASDVESSSSSMPLKRTRGSSSSNGIQVPSCLVDGCNSDLTKCRDYHRRHKVCETHSKTPKVTIAGREQRFCQQCSRFHSLGEFDEEKRSCRKRLDGHNRRRRKPQPEPMSLSSGRFFSSYQGTRFSPFHNPQAFPNAAMASAAVTTKQEFSDIRKNPLTGSLNQSYNSSSGGGKEFSFLQSSSCTHSEASSVTQSLMDSNSALNNCANSHRFFSNNNWLHRDSVDSSCALSLLSSTTPNDTKEIGLNHMLQHQHQQQQPNSSSSPSPASGRAQQPLFPTESLHYSGLGMVMSDQPVAVVTSAMDTTDGDNFHCQEMFRLRTDHGSSSSFSGGHHHHHHHNYHHHNHNHNHNHNHHHFDSQRGNRVPP
ncbi:squamosa promoter-binding-like protein 16 [Cannabis sativa]|uniref:squamosa promoter-binding-like protein 16 n=1 Tax=Cannabis sativa TaxID=3483 RepID=UPI0029CA4859|nr:squamosa promoter-binding-like protein 16 [Cannabis sativa]